MALKSPNKPLSLGRKMIVFSLLIGLVAGFTAIPVQAIEALRITSISVDVNDTTVTVRWFTNLSATGRVDYGTSTGNYAFRVDTNQKKTDQVITLHGLQPETTYFFKITAIGDFAQVSSFEQSFKTQKRIDNTAPIISRVGVVYLTGTTATIQWQTDEESTSEIEFGLTQNYGSTRGDGRLVRIHDLTISGLRESTTYQYRVKSKDRDNNVAIWFNSSFRTADTKQAEQSELQILDLRPASENDPLVTEISAVITWRTNKLASGKIRYSKNPNPGITVVANLPRDFFHSVTLTDLQPGTLYYYEVESTDIFGRRLESEGHSFKTKGTTNTLPVANDNGQVRGVSNFSDGSVCSNQSALGLPGFFGSYFNLPQDHPDMEVGNRGLPIAAPFVGPANDWYEAKWFSFERVDSSLNFGRFSPVDEDLPGDPSHFAVHWRAIIESPATGAYTFTMTSDDDSWLFVDGSLEIDHGGLHGATDKAARISLSKGLHVLDIYYADRQRAVAVFRLTTASNLNFYSLPPGCGIDNFLGNSAGTSSNQTIAGQGQVLGAANEGEYDDGYNKGYTDGLNDSSNGLDYNDVRGNTGTHSETYNQGYQDGYAAGYKKGQGAYVCNPNLGYTKFKALYKTSDSPDVWAILETGEKHYITSPESFGLYQCQWGQIQTVSRARLTSYPNARLVRTPANPTIYHLFQRPERQWLKINIPSPTVFISYPGNFWGNVARINQLDVNAYPNVRLIKGPNDPAVYLIEGSSKRHIASEAVFNRLQFEWFEVVELNDIHLESYQAGGPLQ